MLQYRTGEDVRVGDVVAYAGDEGIVEHVILPGTEDAVEFQAASGGLMFLTYWGVRFLIEDLVEEEDFEFISRFNDSVVERFRATGQLLDLYYAGGEPMCEGDEVSMPYEGKLKKARIKTCLLPFSDEAWKKERPEGLLVVVFDDGMVCPLAPVPCGIRLLKRNTY